MTSPGYSSRSRRTTPGTHSCAAELKDAISSPPVCPERRSSTIPVSRARLPMSSSDSAASRRPVAVGTMPRPAFSKRVSPVSRWRAVMCWLIVDGV